MAFVFHDETLERLTARRGAVADQDTAALLATRLAGSDETIPTLGEVLAMVAGRVPILIELKSPDRNVRPLCRAVQRALDNYGGEAAVMSFDPQVCRWFARHQPLRTRGLVMTEQDARRWHDALGRRLAIWWARPHFLACDIRDLPSRLSIGQRRRNRLVLTWTVRSEADRRTAAAHADQVIYETPGR